MPGVPPPAADPEELPPEKSIPDLGTCLGDPILTHTAVAATSRAVHNYKFKKKSPPPPSFCLEGFKFSTYAFPRRASGIKGILFLKLTLKLLLYEYGVLIWSDENVLELDRDGGCKTR